MNWDRPWCDDKRLIEAIGVGAVRIDSLTEKIATIMAPPGFDKFSDDEILAQLRLAGELGKRLERLGFKVRY